MLFNSLKFALFLPAVFTLFWLCPQRFRWCVLLLSSYYFYMSWNVEYVILIAFVTIISYSMAILIHRTEKMVYKKIGVATACISCLAVLFVFKYYNFFIECLIDLLQANSVSCNLTSLNILLPVGISFYTFQTLSYVIDVYRGEVDVEYHLGRYATFVSFFPQLVAGPIERSSNLLPQINKQFQFDYKEATYGLKLMTWGFFKKIVIADTLAQYVDSVFNNLQGYSGFAYVVVVCMFSFQIYCDFSGYSDIAIGVARLFNIKLMRNFDAPYFAVSIKEFWSRWHISLSTWFRDYLYIPLGGNRCNKLRHQTNLLITFLVSGLWHGANWTYVLWGALHGIAQVAENILFCTKKRKKNLLEASPVSGVVSLAAVFVFTTVTWVFFRASTLEDAVYVFRHMFDGVQNVGTYINSGRLQLEIYIWEAIDMFVMMTILVLYDFFSLKVDVIEKISGMRSVVRWSVYIAFIVLMLYLHPLNTGGEFIYFQF